MSVLEWAPFKDLVELSDKMNRLFEESSRQETGQEYQGGWVPAVDVYETDDSLIIQIDLPGLARENMQIELERSILTIRGQRKIQKDLRQQNFHVMERAYGPFRRSFRMPENVEADKAWAKLLDGVLEIRIPKRREPEPRRIKISVE